jgi:hypothetical protein
MLRTRKGTARLRAVKPEAWAYASVSPDKLSKLSTAGYTGGLERFIKKGGCRFGDSDKATCMRFRANLVNAYLN